MQRACQKYLISIPCIHSSIVDQYYVKMTSSPKKNPSTTALILAPTPNHSLTLNPTNPRTHRIHRPLFLPRPRPKLNAHAVLRSHDMLALRVACDTRNKQLERDFGGGRASV